MFLNKGGAGLLKVDRQGGIGISAPMSHAHIFLGRALNSLKKKLKMSGVGTLIRPGRPWFVTWALIRLVPWYVLRGPDSSCEALIYSYCGVMLCPDSFCRALLRPASPDLSCKALRFVLRALIHPVGHET